MSASIPQYDVVIVGAGVSGNLIAKELGLAGKKVLILEAGLPVPDSREEYMENFYLALAKTPEAPYPALAGRQGSKFNPVGELPDPAKLPTPRATVLSLGKSPDVSYLVQQEPFVELNPNDPNPQNPPTDPETGQVRGLQFSSTFERNGGGTSWHWLGTSLRELENDIRLKTTYGHGEDWPLTYSELQELWALAEQEIGVSASVAQQEPLEVVGLKYPPGYQYPMQAIPMSLVDQAVSSAVAGLQVPGMLDGQDDTLYDVFVTPTPAGRNSEPYDDRRVCAGNTNCIPICPIQAKWDPTVTLGKALDTGNVKVSYQSVAYNVAVDATGKNVTQIDYYVWSRAASGKLTKKKKSVSSKVYVLACHAIENAKLLLLSNNWNGIANSSDQVGRNLMDHPLYLTWALAPQPIFGYRGPLATSGIESLRDGEFRKYRSSFRMEIGNEGWNFSKGDPYTTTMDFIQGTNNSNVNPPPGGSGQPVRLGGLKLVEQLNNIFTRQFRIGCMFDQSPLAENRVTLDVDKETGKPNHVDGLGLPRPKVEYGLDPYTMEGFRMAAYVCSKVYERMGATEFTTNGVGGTGDFTYKGENYHYYGAGHVVGTHRMGDDSCTSVVDASQRSHDVQNMWIVGSGSFPTVCTANPTLTLMGLAFKSAKSILAALGS
ncbi:MAG TPA: GMC family oxidoreductase [Pyrinomonadaceae bacterium]|nr:GMC family oxidoreductase [Pyrinomonadaceae bacterium]